MEKFKAVRIFVRAVEARSFARAAATLGLTPSAVSKAVSALEQEFGVRLLHRTTRRIAATEDGAAYYERCRRLLADYEEAESALRQGSAGPRGTLKVDMPVTVARIFVEPALPGFLAAHPGLRVEARLSDRRVDLLEENVDAAIRLGVLEDTRLIARKLRQDDWVTVASPAYLRRRGVPEVPEDLRGHDCLNYVFLPSGRPFEWQFERAGERRTAAVAGQLAANDADTLLAAALQGAGIMQAAGYVVDRHLAEARLRRILADWTAPGPTLWYVYPSAKHLSPKVRVFGEFLVALLKNPAVGPTSGSE